MEQNRFSPILSPRVHEINFNFCETISKYMWNLTEAKYQESWISQNWKLFYKRGAKKSLSSSIDYNSSTKAVGYAKSANYIHTLDGDCVYTGVPGTFLLARGAAVGIPFSSPARAWRIDTPASCCTYVTTWRNVSLVTWRLCLNGNESSTDREVLVDRSSANYIWPGKQAVPKHFFEKCSYRAYLYLFIARATAVAGFLSPVAPAVVTVKDCCCLCV